MTPPSDRRTFLKGAAGVAALPLVPEPALAAAPLRLSAPVDVALIGAGRQGRAILAELAKIEEANVVAVCDTVASRLSSGLRRAPGAEGHEDWRQMLDAHPSVGAVVVATPTHLHLEPAIGALERGKHVYCEAPLAHTLDDARAIAGAARGAEGVFATGMQGRTNPIYILARKFYRSGAVRDAVTMRAHYHRKMDWRTPARDPKDEQALNWKLDPAVSLGLAGEMGVHQFDVFHWLLEEYPTSVRGTGDVVLHDDGRQVPDTVTLDFTYSGGRHLLYEATLANSFEGTYEVLHGSMGTLKLAWGAGWMFKEADAPTLGFEPYANREYFHNEAGITLIADATKIAAQDPEKLKEGVGLPNDPVYYSLGEWLKAATEGVKIACTAEEGMRAAAVAIAAKAAVDAPGEDIAIPPSMLQVDEG